MLALPHLTPGYSLKIATLPANEDPDSLIRSGRAGRVRSRTRRRPAVGRALFAALASGVGDGPEQRAALRARLEAAAQAIGDRILASEFRSALLDRKFFGRPARDAAATRKHPPTPRGSGIESARRPRLSAR